MLGRTGLVPAKEGEVTRTQWVWGWRRCRVQARGSGLTLALL